MKPSIAIYSRWNLYWVSSDGEEDCFVVARNLRSAARVDADHCGFDASDLTVSRVKAVPEPLARLWEKKGRKEGHYHPWPWYADRWLLRKLGARFREREGLSETLIDDVVYSNGSDGPVRPRLVGRKYLEEFRAVKAFARYGHEDRYSPSQSTLLTLLGMCVARCQEIEHLIAHSFILGGLIETERRKYKTILDLTCGWKRKTLGQMLRLIEDGYEIEPTIHASLQLFLQMRNQLVHGLTTHDQYDIRTSWGQDETIAFLSLFELISRPIRQAFRASLYASIDYGNSYLLREDPGSHHELTKRQKNQIPLFATFFKPRIGSSQQNDTRGS